MQSFPFLLALHERNTAVLHFARNRTRIFYILLALSELFITSVLLVIGKAKRRHQRRLKAPQVLKTVLAVLLNFRHNFEHIEYACSHVLSDLCARFVI